MRILHLTIKRRYFDQIAEGRKAFEFRQVKPFWEKKLIGREYDIIIIRNGYNNHCPTMKLRYKGFTYRTSSVLTGKPERLFAIDVSEIISIENYKN